VRAASTTATVVTCVFAVHKVKATAACVPLESDYNLTTTLAASVSHLPEELLLSPPAAFHCRKNKQMIDSNVNQINAQHTATTVYSLLLL